jgi:hypothetical protein
MSKNCCPSHYTNFISLIPDESEMAISPSTETGWYVLYPPSNSIKQQLPIPIYHTYGKDTYTGWTSRVPLDCVGNTNYNTGKCELVFSRVEEAPAVWGKDSYTSVNKTELSLVGRCIYPKVTDLLSLYPETYCFYTRSQFKVKDLYPFTDTKAKTNWNLGFQSSREIPGQVLVSEKVFGTPINLDLRVVGNYRRILDSYGLKTVLDPNSLVMASVDTKAAFEDLGLVYWQSATQSFSIVLDGRITSIGVVFSNPVTGNLSTTFNTTLIIEEIIPSKAWKIITSQGLTNLNLSLAGIISPPGTIVTVVIGNQVTEITL